MNLETENSIQNVNLRNPPQTQMFIFLKVKDKKVLRPDCTRGTLNCGKTLGLDWKKIYEEAGSLVTFEFRLKYLFLDHCTSLNKQVQAQSLLHSILFSMRASAIC